MKPEFTPPGTIRRKNPTANRVVILAVKRTVVAFDKHTGAQLWSQNLKAGIGGGDFVTVVADEERVYAHTGGEMFCLDLATGSILWKDGLSGLSYGIASIALPRGAACEIPAMAARIQQDQAQDAGTHSHSSPS
jgi:outer membrane protein assembly factor BamB